MKSILLSLVVLPILGCPMSAVTLQNSAVSDKCPDQPIQSLQASNVKSITLPAKLSDTASQEMQLGYTFEAQTGQKINLRNIDNLCVWIYSSDNQLLSGADLPKTGKYTVQIASKKDSRKLDIDIGFNGASIRVIEGSINFNIIDPDGRNIGTVKNGFWRGKLPMNGDYALEVSSSNVSSYRFDIEVL